MFRKILAILSILLGAFLAISSTMQGVLLVHSLMKQEHQNSAYTSGFLLGQGIALILFVIVAFFLIRYGIRSLKTKR